MIDPSPWPGLDLIEPASGGTRNDVWLGHLGQTLVSVRRSQRTGESLAWELDLLEQLGHANFRVPSVIPAGDGRRSVDGIVVQEWLEGHEPSSDADWFLVANELARLHRETADHDQRPGCVNVSELRLHRRSVDADLDRMPSEVVDEILVVFESLANVPLAVVHGDPGPTNIRIGRDGSVGLLDWDESRVDLTWHDLSNLGVQVLNHENHRRGQRLSNAWEAANGWTTSPEYAHRRLAMLGDE